MKYSPKIVIYKIISEKKWIGKRDPTKKGEKIVELQYILDREEKKQ